MMSKLSLPGVRCIITIASGKGGVGKTTVTVNTALALHRLGARVGVFDADIYGPNVPLMLGIHRKKANKGFIPIARSTPNPYVPAVERFGLKVMSVGLLVSEEQVIRPSAQHAGQVVVQTLRDVMWGELDYLLIDLPPSAGQPQEDLLHRVAIQGTVIVTTPQDLSLLDASRSLKMFQEAGVSILGIVENMSYFVCPSCGEQHEIFQHSARWRPKALEDVAVIGRIPLTPAISQSINQADPLVHGHPENTQSQPFLDIARELQKRLTAV